MRVTPDLIGRYKRRAHRLRAKACRAAWRSLWHSLLRNRRRSVMSRTLKRLRAESPSVARQPVSIDRRQSCVINLESSHA
jgi:hypothetical protein